MSKIRVERFDREDDEGPPEAVWEASCPDIELGDALILDGQRYVQDLWVLVAVDDEGNPLR